MSKKYLLAPIILLIIFLIGVFVFPNFLNNLRNSVQNVEGIKIISIKSGEEVFSPIEIFGSINGNGWTAFEAQAGIVRLLDENNAVIGSAILTITDEDWMKEFNNFKAMLEFYSPKDQNGKLVFYNENASGESERNREFILPVRIKKSGETMFVKAYFAKDEITAENCNIVFPVDRTVEKTTAVARAALEELLGGLTEQEKKSGYSTSINPEVKIQKLSIDEKGVAWVDFSKEIEDQVGGSCRVSVIRSQIIFTLLQFPTVKNVVISVDGRTEDILQP